MMSRIRMYIFLFCLIMIGLSSALSFLTSNFFNSAWFFTRGRVTDSYIGEGVDEQGPFYYPVIEYRYEVNGESYRSDNYYGVERKPNRYRYQVDEIVSKHPVGLSIIVYVKVDNPEMSALDIHNPRNRQIRNSVFTALIVIPASIWIYRRHQRRKEERPYSFR